MNPTYIIHPICNYLLVVSTHFKKYISQIGNLPNFQGEQKKQISMHMSETTN